ncbi:hypothetical protein SAMD00019534_036090 [Acytostelium subglobosum LB1]|uniref:hypothetical protein n=1 Tax=Acytostelium subglobosum LB1 TaxID=1410327 RepID=UPI000644AA4E|nr:hypothetical protein SAMD00019534_036090 [Acytostelium subglobosum LB1]GAM20434.1 hypothetical protein SAMD00019534_036090 [Acytostelium subglobosum LB1]|eukprot:XP_012759955.1 hypothetical protein SAMD00019534_036090 [Acytostelium subglobosum LB1]
MIKYLHANGLPFHESTISEAAGSDHLDVIQYLLENKSDTYITGSAMDYAATNGHLNIVLYLHEQRTEGCSSWAMKGAAENGHLDVVRFLHENRTEDLDHSTAFESAAVKGQLSVIQYLHHIDPKIVCRYNALIQPAIEGQTQIVQFICERYPSLRITTFDLMSVRSHQVLEVLDRLMSSQIWEVDRIYNRFQELHVIEYIIDHKTPEYIARCLNDRVLGKSMLLDQSKLFFKLIKHIVNPSTFTAVLLGCTNLIPYCKHNDILEYIYQSCTQDGIGVPFLCPEVDDRDAKYLVLAGLEFIHHKGGLQSLATILHGILMGAIRFGRIDIVKFILDSVGYRPSKHHLSVDLFDRAISHGQVDILQFLLDSIGVDGQLPESRTFYADCVDQAIINGHLEMVRFISCERFKDLICMTTQGSFNNYLKRVLIGNASPDTPRFVDEAGGVYPIPIYQRKLVDKGEYDIVRYLFFNQNDHEKEVLVRELMKAGSRGLSPLFVDLPMAEIVLRHKDGAPFINRQSVDLDKLRIFPLSLVLLTKYLI